MFKFVRNTCLLWFIPLVCFATSGATWADSPAEEQWTSFPHYFNVLSEESLLSDKFALQTLEQLAVPEDNVQADECFCFGQGVEFSQDVVIRGSFPSLKRLSLPPIKRFRLWGNAYWGDGDVSPSGLNLDMNHSTKGAMLGITCPMGCGTLSCYYNYNLSEVTAVARDREQTSHLAGLGLYFNSGGVYMTLLANGGTDSYSFNRNSGDVGLNFEGHQASGSVEIGCEMNTRSLFVLKPFTTLQYTKLWHDDYNLATGSVRDDKKTYNALYSISGAKIDLKLGAMEFLVFQGRLAWVYQMLSENAPMSSYWFGRISGTAAPAQLFYEGTLSPSAFWGGGGVKLTCFSKVSATFDYDIIVNKDQTNHLFSAGALLCW